MILSRLRSQLWGGKAGVAWERGKGPRGRFGAGGMCYCEEGICLPRRKEEGGLALLLKAGAWLNLSRGEGSREGSEPRVLDGSIGPHGQSWKEALQQCGFARLGRTQLHGGWGCSEPPNSCDARPGSPQPHDALHGHTPQQHCTPAVVQHPIGQGDACSLAGFEGSACLCRPQDTAKESSGFALVISREAKDIPRKVHLSCAASGTASSPSPLQRVLRKLRDREWELPRPRIRADWSPAIF